jgi:hypothetical protein
MSELQRIDIKVFAEQGADIDPYAFVPVLQRWIREHSIEGTLIDVADYSHVVGGAGIVLVGHQFNVSIDYSGGMGLLYRQRQPLSGSLQERCAAILRSALGACAQLEGEPEFSGQLKFSREKISFIANDRLAGANDAAASADVVSAVSAAFGDVLGGDVAVSVSDNDSRDRLLLTV